MQYEVMIDAGETANKCTIAPLEGRADFKLMRVRGAGPLGPLNAQILLHHQGRDLIDLKSSSLSVETLACIDCVWNRLGPILKRVQTPLPTFARIPAGFVTAYPRRSGDDSDPDGGLATIEAIFTAAALLGNWDPSLFSKYYFGARYVELNRDRFVELGVLQAADLGSQPTYVAAPRTSKQRRADRGRRRP